MAKIYVQLKKAAVTPDWKEGRVYRVLDVDDAGQRFLLMDMDSGAIDYFGIANCILDGYSDKGNDLVWVKIKAGTGSIGNFETGVAYMVLSIDNGNDRFLLAEPDSKEIRYFDIGDLEHGGGLVNPRSAGEM